MTKLTIIGAGSTVFTKNIVVDLLTIDQFKTIEIALMDIDKNRLIKTKEVLEIISKNDWLKYYSIKSLIEQIGNRLSKIPLSVICLHGSKKVL